MTANDSFDKVTTLPDLGSCHWISWDSSFVQTKIPDPTRMFSFLVCFIMFFRFLQGVQWNVLALVEGFFLNTYVLVFLGAAVGTAYMGLIHSQGNGNNAIENKKRQGVRSPLFSTWNSMPVYDRWAAEWYWWNAWLYHGVMDGAAGSLQGVPVVVSQYHILDRRFITHHCVPWTVGLIELIIMQPLCLCLVYAILTKSPFRFPLECIVTTLHMFGALVFVWAEIYEGQLNIPANDPVGVEGNRFGNVKLFDHDHLVYYWFGFWFCNHIWIWVPLYRLERAVLECVRALRIASSKAMPANESNKND